MSRLESVQALKDRVYATWGEVAVLMNNAGTAPGGGPYDHVDRWRKVLDVNLWGVIHGVQTFAPAMLAQKTPGAIVNTGSKQGITCPPGRHRLQRQQGRREGADRGAGPQPAQRGGQPHHAPIC